MKPIETLRTSGAIAIAVALGMLAITRADTRVLELTAAGHTVVPGATATTQTRPTREILDLGKGREYRGRVVDGRPHGEGTLTWWRSGARFTGQWANGARHGHGSDRDREGGVYVGEYRDGKRAGHGRFTWPNERTYEGAWRAWMRHGEGVETGADGVTRRCTWRWGNLVPGSCSPAG